MPRLQVTYTIDIRKSENSPDTYYTVLLGNRIDRMWIKTAGDQWRSQMVLEPTIGMRFALTPYKEIPRDLWEAVRYHYNAVEVS